MSKGKTKERVRDALRKYKRSLLAWMDMGRLAYLTALLLGLAALYFPAHPKQLSYWWITAIPAVLLWFAPPMFYNPPVKPATVLVAGVTGTITSSMTTVPAVLALPLRLVGNFGGLLGGLLGGGVVIAVAALTEPAIGAAVLVVGSLVLLGLQVGKRRARPKKIQGAGDDSF